MKACVIYISSDGIDPNPTKAKLEGKGYTVVLCPVSVDQAEAAGEGDFSALSDEMRTEIETCDLCVVLISKCADGSFGFGAAVGCAVEGGSDIVGIWTKDSDDIEIPSVLVDYGCDIVGENDPKFDDVIDGNVDSWNGPKGDTAPTPPKSNQSKC
ncbi:MAG: hypothetical protein ACKVOS_05215 [Sphingorhabdus sp.]|uniref:hypothetical protein n=1 Tax=Sphingorhabdus sp. TaxID=1902408 RepID=UPI0038FD33D1